MLYIQIKCKIHMLEHQDRMKNVTSHGKTANTWTKPVTEQLQKEKKWPYLKWEKAAPKRQTSVWSKTSQVTLTAQNTLGILKESGLFVDLCKIYTEIHMYICTHRHYCTYVYAIVNTTALWQVSVSDSGCKQEYWSCAKIHFRVWLPRSNSRKIQRNSQIA